MKRELWKPIPAAPGFEVSNLGKIRRASDRKPYRASIGDGGNIQITLLGSTLRISRLVGEAFQPTYRKSLYARFRNDDKTDCRAANLQWVPRREVTGAPFSRNPKLKTA